MPVLVWRSNSEGETIALGRSLARGFRPPVWIGLTGPLGAGKTRFAQGVAQGLDYPGRVRSPTFVLENRYAGRIPIVHQDLYRLDIVDDEILAGWEENLDAVILVEWAERAAELPDRAIEIEIVPRGEDVREIRVRWSGDLLELDAETASQARSSDDRAVPR
jgi:tRNA threonylcarbamoyladenosine biosynthesis protein TsaE